MKKALLAMSVIAASVAVFASGCTTVIKDATATPPKVTTISQDTIDSRVPPASFFGSSTTEEDDFQSNWMWFCSNQPYPDLDSVSGVTPYAKGYSAKGSLPFDGDRGDFGVNVWALSSTKAATTLAEGAIDQIKDCDPVDTSSGSSGGVSYELKSQNKPVDYSHGKWKGYAIQTKSTYTPASGDPWNATILGVVAYRGNIVALLNFYADSPSDQTAAIEKSTELADKFLDKLDGKK